MGNIYRDIIISILYFNYLIMNNKKENWDLSLWLKDNDKQLREAKKIK
jgi:hypothetical protein